ncbi:MAG: hypothetical protein AAF402_11720 [Pseudomonadota bacterium]
MIRRIQRKLLPFNIDIVNREFASGWAFNRLMPGRPATITFKSGGRIVGKARCDLERPDLVEQNLHRSGYAGFECVFESPLSHESGESLTIHINGSPLSATRFEISTLPNVFTPERPLFFMHIPKTAGTSFNNVLQQYFAQGKSHIHIQTSSLEQQKSMADSGHFLSGHLTLEHVSNIFGNKHAVDLHSILRDPARQLHSHIGWVMGIARDRNSGFYKKHHQLVQKMGRDLFSTDLSKPENLSDLVNNLDGFQIDFFDNIQTRYFLDYRPDRVSQKDCQAALSNLSRMTSVGTTESFAAYVENFCTLYGIDTIPQTTVHNPSKVHPLFDINDSVLEKIIEPLIRYDRQLYSTVSSLSNFAP